MANTAVKITLGVEDAERLANDVRAEVWGRDIPVDPVVVANEMGLKVVEAVLPNDVSGGLIRRRGEDPRIVLNERDSRERKRFTCAHELGHFVYRAETGSADDYEYTDLRDDLASLGINTEEMFANRFAGALLMPADHVRQFVSEKAPTVIMARRFGVSEEAMNMRLRMLGLSH